MKTRWEMKSGDDCPSAKTWRFRIRWSSFSETYGFRIRRRRRGTNNNNNASWNLLAGFFFSNETNNIYPAHNLQNHGVFFSIHKNLESRLGWMMVGFCYSDAVELTMVVWAFFGFMIFLFYCHCNLVSTEKMSSEKKWSWVMAIKKWVREKEREEVFESFF